MQMAKTYDAVDLFCEALNRRFKSQKMDFEQFMNVLYNIKSVLDENELISPFTVDGQPLSESEIKAVTAFIRMMRQTD
jgi:hypothetical protein